MLMIQQSFWLLLAMFIVANTQNSYEWLDDGAHGVRVSSNDYFAIMALNSFNLYEIVPAPYLKQNPCYVVYPDADQYVYSLVTLLNYSDPNPNDTYAFMQVAEKIETADVTFSIIYVNKSNCHERRYVEQAVVTNTVHLWSGTHQQYMLLKINPSQTHAYVFADSFVFSFDLVNNSVVDLMNMSTFMSNQTFLVHSMDITDTWGVVAGFWVLSLNKLFSFYGVLLISLRPLKAHSIISILNEELEETATASVYSRLNEFAITVNSAREMVLVGTPKFNVVKLFRMNTTGTYLSLDLISTIVGPQSNVGFGHSLAWIDEKKIAIVLYDVPNSPWSRSELWIYDMDGDFKYPLTVFPNNQQILNTQKPSLFLHVVNWLDRLLILTDQDRVLIFKTAPPGFYSTCDVDNRQSIMVCNQKKCLPGTFKNESDFGPCIVCPPRTKNPGNEPCTECTPCLADSFCPMASINDLVNLQSYPSYTQTFSYPDTPYMNNFDDLIVHYMFSINVSRRCRLLSPLFWTLILIGLGSIIALIMILIKRCRSVKVDHHRNLAKQILKRIDIIGEGERWIGGLFSISILTLFMFAFWFAIKYLKLYPIENDINDHALCDETLHNSIFDNALQLPLPNLDGSRWRIFDLLDQQPITMTLDLVNTGVNCSDLVFQYLHANVNYVHLPMSACILQQDNITLSVSVLLPQHRMTLQLNITGPYFVGGFRLCLRGPGLMQNESQLHELDTCQAFFTPNQTLARFATLSVVLVKVINQTKPIDVGGSSKFDGRWAPTFTDSVLSDEVVYEQYGQYLRFAAQSTVLTIKFSEQPFFLQNNQGPVIRSAELAFHTLLFCTLVIDLFSLSFVIFKLLIKPISTKIICCRHCSTNLSTEENWKLPKMSKNQRNFYAMLRHRFKMIELRKDSWIRQRRKSQQKRAKIPREIFYVSDNPEFKTIDIERTSL